MKALVALVLALSMVQVASAQTADFDAFFSWAEGSWEGEKWGGLGRETFEVLAPGKAMGMYAFVLQDSLRFMEFFTFDQQSLEMKHFNPDMTSWEEKDSTLSLGFESVTPTKLSYRSFTLEQVTEDELLIRVFFERKDGSSHWEEFAYRRVP